MDQKLLKKYIFYTSDIGGSEFIQTNTELQVHTKITVLNHLNIIPHLRRNVTTFLHCVDKLDKMQNQSCNIFSRLRKSEKEKLMSATGSI